MLSRFVAGSSVVWIKCGRVLRGLGSGFRRLFALMRGNLSNRTWGASGAPFCARELAPRCGGLDVGELRATGRAFGAWW